MNKFSLLTLSAILLSSTALASDTGQNDDSNLPGDVQKALNAVRSAGAHVGERLNTFYTAAMGDEDERKAAQSDLPVSVRQFHESSTEAAEHVSHGASHAAATVSGAVGRAAATVADEARGWHDDMLAQHRSSSPENTDEVNYDEDKGSNTVTSIETVRHDDATLTAAATTSDAAPSRSSSPVTISVVDTDGGTGSDEGQEVPSDMAQNQSSSPDITVTNNEVGDENNEMPSAVSGLTLNDTTPTSHPASHSADANNTTADTSTSTTTTADSSET